MGRRGRRQAAGTPPTAGDPALTARPAGAPRFPEPADLAWAFVIASVAIVLFLPALKGGFLLWDDPSYLLGNATIRSSPPGELLLRTLLPSPPNWHPLTWWCHAAMWRAFGPSASAHHALPVLLHGLAAAILYLGLRVLQALAPAAGGELRDRLLAAMATLLFALHPLRVESVAWVAETKDPLAGALSLAALTAAAASFDPADPTRRRRAAAIAGSVFACLALLSKPMAVTLPAILTLLDLALERGQPVGAVLRRRTRAWLPVWIAAAATAALEMVAARNAMAPPELVSPAERVVVALRAPGDYLLDLVAPLALTPFEPLQKAKRLDPATGLRILVTGLLFVVAVAAWRRRRAVSLAIAAGFAILAPVSGLTQAGSQGSADRFTYLAHVPLLALLAAAPALRRGGRSLAAIGLCGVATIAAAVATRNHLPVYASSRALWERVAAIHPDSSLAWSQLGVALREEGDRDGARTALQRAVATGRADAVTVANLARLRLEEGAIEDAARLADAAVRAAGSTADTEALRAQLLLAAGRPGEALQAAERSLALEPGIVEVVTTRAQALTDLGRLEEALEAWNLAVSLAPERSDTLVGRAVLLASTGRPREARIDLDAALQRSPRHAAALVNRGVLRAREGDRSGARVDFEGALAASPNDPDALYNAILLDRSEGRDQLAAERLRRLGTVAPALAQALAETGGRRP